MATTLESARETESTALRPETAAGTLAPSTLAVHEITSPEALEGLAGEWAALVARSRDRHLSVTSPWVRAWWRSFGGGAALRVLAVRDGSRLVGLAPFLSRRETASGVPCRVVRFLSNRFVPWCDFLVDADVPRPAVLRAVFEHLDRRPGRPDLVSLRNVPGDSGTIDALGAATAGNALAVVLVNPRRSPIVPIEGTWEDYLASFSSRSRKSIARAFRTHEEEGLRFEEVRGGPRSAEVLERGLELESAGWKGENGSAILDDPRVAGFHRDLGQLPGACQYALWRGDALIAWDFCVYEDGVCYALKTAYDEGHSKLAPGMLIQLLELRALFESRAARAYDQLPPESEYKDRWARTYMEQTSVRVYGRTLVGRTIWFLDTRVRVALRRVDWLRQAKGKLVRT